MHGRRAVRPGPSPAAPASNSFSVPAAPMIAASGVFRSCEIEVSSAERSRSASAASLARSTSATSWMRSMASAAWSASASKQALLLGREQRTLLVVVEADDADRRAAGLAAGDRAASRPAACRRRARRRGRAPTPSAPPRCRHRPACRRADSRPCTAIVPFSGRSSTTRTFSIEAIWKAVAHSTSSSVPVPASFLREQIEIFGGPRALARRGRLALDAAGQVAGDEGDDEEERKRDDAFRVAMVRV